MRTWIAARDLTHAQLGNRLLTSEPDVPGLVGGPIVSISHTADEVLVCVDQGHADQEFGFLPDSQLLIND